MKKIMLVMLVSLSSLFADLNPSSVTDDRLLQPSDIKYLFHFGNETCVLSDGIIQSALLADFNTGSSLVSSEITIGKNFKMAIGTQITLVISNDKEIQNFYFKSVTDCNIFKLAYFKLMSK